MTDIVERLMICAKFDPDQKEAADTIEALRTENKRLREALKPFADVAEKDIGEDEHDIDLFRPMIRHNRAPRLTCGDLRAARAAIREGENDDWRRII